MRKALWLTGVLSLILSAFSVEELLVAATARAAAYLPAESSIYSAEASDAQKDQQGKEMVIKFFRLINKSGMEVKVQVLADGKELFVQRLDARLKPSEGIVHPATEVYPSAELKASISREAAELMVKETQSLKKERAFAISRAKEKADAGFQIILNRDGIEVTQDYQPVR